MSTIPAAQREATVLFRKPRNRDWQLGYLLILPAAVVIVGLIAYPFLYSIWMSLQVIRVGGVGRFVWFQNYASLLYGVNSGRFWNSVLVTVEYTVAAELGKFLIGIVTALILHHSLK